MGHEIAAVTTCNKCGAKFYGPAVTIIGQPAARLQHYLSELGSHINTAHAKDAEYIQAQGLQHMGLMYLSNFDTTDKDLREWKDFLRWQIQQATIAGRISDKTLIEKSAGLMDALMDLAIDEEVNQPTPAGVAKAADLLLEALKLIRNTYEEPGKFERSNAVSPEKRIITPVR
jgi:hypothetical protein